MKKKSLTIKAYAIHNFILRICCLLSSIKSMNSIKFKSYIAWINNSWRAEFVGKNVSTKNVNQDFWIVDWVTKTMMFIH